MDNFLHKLKVFFFKPSALNVCVFFLTSLCFFSYYFPIIGSIFFPFFLAEVYCRAQYFFWHRSKKEKRFFITNNDVPFSNHPYLPWTIRKNWNPPKNRKICEDKSFMLGGVPTNNLGLFFSDEEKKNINPKKTADVFRILVLGDSVPLNFASPLNQINYPGLIEKKLRCSFPNKKIEVINGSFFSYTTQELLVKFLFNFQYLNPDFIIFHAGYADIRAYFTENFETDFSHFRGSVSKYYPYLVYLASLIPFKNFYFVDFLVSGLLSHGNLKSDLIKMINKKNDIDLKQPIEQGLETFSKNILTLIHVCKGYKIPLGISTYCHYLNDQRKGSEAHQVFHSVIERQNDIIRKLCEDNDIFCIDNEKFMNFSDQMFIDEVHFSEEGMQAISENFLKVISPYILRNSL